MMIKDVVKACQDAQAAAARQKADALAGLDAVLDKVEIDRINSRDSKRATVQVPIATLREVVKGWKGDKSDSVYRACLGAVGSLRNARQTSVTVEARDLLKLAQNVKETPAAAATT